MSEKGEVGLLELVGTQRASTRRRAFRERNVTSRVVANEAAVDGASEGGPGGQDHCFLCTDTMAGLRVGSCFGAEREAPSRLRRQPVPPKRCRHRPTR